MTMNDIFCFLAQEMKGNYSTSRLKLNQLSQADREFIIKLLNTPGWIKFIGDRNIKTHEDAKT